MGPCRDRRRTGGHRRRPGQRPRLRESRCVRRLLRSPGLTTPRRTGCRVCLLSAGTDGISGGHRYHQHLLAAAPDAGFSMRVAPPGMLRELPPADVVVIDSLYAWRLVGAVRRSHRPLAVAIVHQHPGGTDGSGWSRSLRRRLDLATYRACDLVVTPGPIVANLLVAEYGLDPSRVEVIEPGCDLAPAGAVPALRAGRRLGCAQRRQLAAQQGDPRAARRRRCASGVTTSPCISWVAPTSSPQYTADIRRRCGRPDLVDRVVVHGATRRPGRRLACTRPPMRSRSRAESRRTAAPLVRRWPPECRSSGGAPPICAVWSTIEVEGLLVAPGQIGELTGAIHRLAIDSADRHALAEGARRRGARLPTWRQTTSRFFDALSRLMAEAVEPPHDRGLPSTMSIRLTPASSTNKSPGDRRRNIERPRQRGLDRPDMGHDDHD